MSVYSVLPRSLVCNNEENMHIQVTGMNLALIPRIRQRKTKCGSDGKECACNAGYLGLIPGFGRSLEGGHGNELQYSYLENSHGQRSLVGYSP